MRRFTVLALWAAAAFAQSSEPFKPKPPTAVDSALRARVQEFFELQVKGEYRKAELLVAEDTKDYYYTHDKPKYLSCEINKIDYTDKFTKATALVACDRYVMMPGFSDKPMKVPGMSTWKLVEGKWYWYVDQDAVVNTPFGKMTAGAFPANGAAPPPPSLGAISMSPDFLMTQVKMDPQSVRLKPGETARVTFSNSAPGPVDLVMTGKLAGIEARFDHSKVKPGEDATLTLRAAKEAKSGVLNVQVEQTTQTLPLHVTIVE